jgi:hypothetical protein
LREDFPGYTGISTTQCFRTCNLRKLMIRVARL